MESRYEGINYIWKAEMQKNENIHYHILTDAKINWKVIRKNWNQIQKIYVDKYQIKMKEKYKNGYYFDKEIKNEKGEIIENEIQLKRYEKGKKANWRNPNSTDLKETEDIKEIGKYILHKSVRSSGKYVYIFATVADASEPYIFKTMINKEFKNEPTKPNGNILPRCN